MTHFPTKILHHICNMHKETENLVVSFTRRIQISGSDTDQAHEMKLHSVYLQVSYLVLSLKNEKFIAGAYFGIIGMALNANGTKYPN